MGALAPLKDLWIRCRTRLRPTVERWRAARSLRPARKVWLRDLNFDLTSICNLRCAYCSLDHGRPARFMEIDLFERVLDEIEESDRLSVKRIQLHHGGDALVHPKFPEILAAIARRKGRPGFPEVTCLTNGMLLSGRKREAILETGAIDYLRFSLDGGTREEFERMRPPAKWDRVLRNVEEFLDANDSGRRPIRTGIIALFDRPGGALDPRFTALTERVDHYMPREPHRWDGSVDLGLPPSEDGIPEGLCMFVLVQAVVLFDGRVAPCCADLNGRGPIGNLADRRLHEILRGEERLRMVRLMKQGSRCDIDLCRNCEVGID